MFVPHLYLGPANLLKSKCF